MLQLVWVIRMLIDTRSQIHSIIGVRRIDGMWLLLPYCYYAYNNITAQFPVQDKFTDINHYNQDMIISYMLILGYAFVGWH